MKELYNLNVGTNEHHTIFDKVFFSKFSGKHESKTGYAIDAGRPHWYLTDILSSLKNCEAFSVAESSGLLQKLIISSLLLNTSNSGTPFASSSSFSTSSSLSLSLDSREWWFNDLTVLSPKIVVAIVRNLIAHESNDKSFVLTRFLLYYLCSAGQKLRCYSDHGYELEFDEIVNIAVGRVVLMGRGALSCRRLFWVLRVVSGLNLSSNSRKHLEEMIGERLDESTLDDLLVSGHDEGVYDVSLVIRLVKIFVTNRKAEVSLKKMRKVGMLVDMYLKEISPDKILNVSKFAEVVRSLPDNARECFDEVYRALGIYIEAHPELSFEERTMLCQCLNCEKLTPEASKDLARNPKVPPEVSMQALVHQLSKIQKRGDMTGIPHPANLMVGHPPKADDVGSTSAPPANEKKQSTVFGIIPWRLCREVRGQMSKSVSKSKIISYNDRELAKIY